MKETRRMISRIIGILFLLIILGGNLANSTHTFSFIKDKAAGLLTQAESLWEKADNITLSNAASADTLEEVPDWNGTDEYAVINNNQPEFSSEDIEKGKSETWLNLSKLDALGRTGEAYACLNASMLPTEERGEIGMVKPSGWHTVKYDKRIVEDLYALNRGHQIAHCLCGLNAEERNLFTQTRQSNLYQKDFEVKTAQYLERHPNNHVLYRATPIFKGTNLMAHGILLEAQSIEDNGIAFCVYIYNAQKYLEFNYATGESKLTAEGEAILNQ